MPEILETRTVFHDPHSFCGPISMLEQTRDGTLLLVFRHADWEGPDRATHAHPSTRTSLIQSRDGGKIWSAPIQPDPNGGNGVCIAQLGEALIVNNFHWIVLPAEDKSKLANHPYVRDETHIGMVSALEGVFTTRSFDGGNSWETPVKLEIPHAEYASTAGRVIELPDGTWLMPMNGDIREGEKTSPWVAKSEDRGETWSFLSSWGEPNPGLRFAENRILALPDGSILSLVRTETGNFWQSHSNDGGQTWSPIQETPIPCLGSSPADLLLLKDGRILCTYGNRKRDPLGVRACLSEDGGQTWRMDEEIILRDDATHHDMGYPSSQQLDDGSILTITYWQDENQVRHLVSTRWRL